MKDILSLSLSLSYFYYNSRSLRFNIAKVCDVARCYNVKTLGKSEMLQTAGEKQQFRFIAEMEGAVQAPRRQVGYNKTCVREIRGPKVSHFCEAVRNVLRLWKRNRQRDPVVIILRWDTWYNVTAVMGCRRIRRGRPALARRTYPVIFCGVSPSAIHLAIISRLRRDATRCAAPAARDNHFKARF